VCRNDYSRRLTACCHGQGAIRSHLRASSTRSIGDYRAIAGEEERYPQVRDIVVGVIVRRLKLTPDEIATAIAPAKRKLRARTVRRAVFKVLRPRLLALPPGISTLKKPFCEVVRHPKQFDF